MLPPGIATEIALKTDWLSAPSYDRETLAPAPALLELRQGPYRVRLASSETDRLAAFRLRFQVFNLELNEGLETAYASGYDTDEFDPVCDHLLVEHAVLGKVVGTYRLQSGAMALANRGYYSEREFNFEPYEPLRNHVIELGRACIHRDHRSTDVLYLLWRGIARYALRCGGRYLVGCCSLTSQDPGHGTAVYEALHDYLVDRALQTHPKPQFAMPLVNIPGADSHLPKLQRTYLSIGAKICGPPAIDREFKTIDFLTLLDLEKLHPRISVRFLKP
jgi:putative hemolysin